MADHQKSKEEVALDIVRKAIGDKWIDPKTYDDYLDAVAKAIFALGGTTPKAPTQSYR